MTRKGRLIGIGVGPGPAKLIPLGAWEALEQADVILAPRAKHVSQSIARQCLAGLNIPEEKFQEIIYNMDSDRNLVKQHYTQLAYQVLEQLEQGKTVAYLTIGDSMTYSTYSYLLNAILQIAPDLVHTTFPGITSYSAIAATLNWPIGQGKERVLILPCPDDMKSLRFDIETHDIVVLMKIGARLKGVLELLREMAVIDNCAFASRLGLSDEVCSDNIVDMQINESVGYLSTMLIRKNRVQGQVEAESFTKVNKETRLGGKIPVTLA